jgi:uncharacterized membrane protein
MTSRAQRSGAAVLCLLLAIVHTWPLALDLAHLSRNDNGDAQLNEWILAWVAHQLARDPIHLFEANIFYPAHDALAFSEPLIVPAFMGAPLAWIGASPVLVYNLILIAGFALTAFVTCLLIEAWTGDLLAGLLAGSMFAFNTHTLTRLAHIQGIHIYGLPLALLAVDVLIRPPLRARQSERATGRFAAKAGGPIALLVVSMVLMAYTSGYLVVFAAVMIAVALLTRVPEWWTRARTVAAQFAVATVMTAVVVLPVYLPYRRVAREQHMVRTLDIVKDYSATLPGYLAASGRIHFATWSGRFFKDPVDSFFPGIIILALAGVAVIAAARSRELRPRVFMLLAIAAMGLVLSLGTATPAYGVLFHIFPPMQGLRAAARFGNLFLLGIALLGGLGFAALRKSLPPEGGSHRSEYVAIVLIALANIESLRAPFQYREFTGVPGIYRLLAQEPGPVVLAEQPFFPRRMIFENAPYVLNSTAHWRPLMNGYSGYTPASYQTYADTFWYFPEERAMRAMKDAGVTHVMVHPLGFMRDATKVIEQISARSDMELIAVGSNGIRLYRLRH